MYDSLFCCCSVYVLSFWSSCGALYICEFVIHLFVSFGLLVGGVLLHVVRMSMRMSVRITASTSNQQQQPKTVDGQFCMWWKRWRAEESQRCNEHYTNARIERQTLRKRTFKACCGRLVAIDRFASEQRLWLFDLAHGQRPANLYRHPTISAAKHPACNVGGLCASAAVRKRLSSHAHHAQEQTNKQNNEK